MSATAQLLPLRRADGSATYSYGGYTVLAAVNGPLEVPRRDELAEEAALDVMIKPAAGVGGVRERHLESILQNTLRHLILVSAHPRTLIQVVLQVMSCPESETGSVRLAQSASNLDLLPPLLQASMLALLSTSLPLTATLSSVFLAVSPEGTFIDAPTPKQIETATSVHALAFSSQGNLILAQCEGEFNIDQWEAAANHAKRLCLGSNGEESDAEDVDMSGAPEDSVQDFVRGVLGRKIVDDQSWKEGIK